MKKSIKSLLITALLVTLGSASLVNASNITNEDNIVKINTGEENQNNVYIYINGSAVQKSVAPGGSVTLSADEVQGLINQNGWDYKLEQWEGKLYTDSECTQEFTAGTPVGENTHLYTNFTKNSYKLMIVSNTASDNTNGFTYEQEQEVDMPTVIEVIEGEYLDPAVLKVGQTFQAEAMMCDENGNPYSVPITLEGYYTHVEYNEETGRYVYPDEYRWDFNNPVNNANLGIEGPDLNVGINYDYTELYAKWSEDFDVADLNTNAIYGNDEPAEGTSEKKETFTITFNFETDTEKVTTTQEVEYGQTIIEPEAPIRDGYEFVGWVAIDGDKDIPYDFNTPVTTDVELHAKWNEQAELLDEALPGAMNKSIIQKLIDAIKTVIIVLVISLIPIIIFLALAIGFITKLKKVVVLNNRNTDEYKESNYKEVFNTSVKTEGNVIAELFRQEDRVWRLTIPEHIINNRTTDDFKVVLNKQFCSRYNGEQLIVVINAEGKKDHGFVIDKEENEILIDIKID